METTQTMTNTVSATVTPLGADDPRALFGTAVGLAGSVISAVAPEQLDDATPCTELDVRHLLGHLVEVLQRVSALARGENPFTAPGPQSVPDDGWLDAWAASAHEVQAAWSDDAVLDRVMTLPWMQAPGRIILLGYVSEVTVHTWDLARATGQAPGWDPQVLQAAYGAIQAALPAADRQAMFDAVLNKMPPEMRTGAPPFVDVVPTAADAPLIDRLVAWTGRHP